MKVPATGEQDQMGSKCDPVLGRRSESSGQGDIQGLVGQKIGFERGVLILSENQHGKEMEKGITIHTFNLFIYEHLLCIAVRIFRNEVTK